MAPPAAPSPLLAAVILTGGTGSRLGDVDKAALEVDGQTLLEHALAGTATADEVVVVGPEAPTSRPVTWTREDPPGGGPAAGLLAGLDALAGRPQLVCVLAVDMPRFTVGTLSRLVDVLHRRPDVDAACLGDGTGHQQWLAGVYRYDALAGLAPARPDERHGLSMRRLVAPLLVAVVPAIEDEARDVDTWADLHDLRGDA